MFIWCCCSYNHIIIVWISKCGCWKIGMRFLFIKFLNTTAQSVCSFQIKILPIYNWILSKTFKILCVKTHKFVWIFLWNNFSVCFYIWGNGIKVFSTLFAEISIYYELRGMHAPYVKLSLFVIVSTVYSTS